MDLVKIGFQINANGLKDANTEVDKLLGKVDNIGTKGKKASSEFESSQKKVQDSVKKTEKVSTSASDKMIQKQQTINQLLPYMDKGVANLASSFWLVSKEAQSFNKFLDIMGEQDAIVKQKKQTEALVKEQQKQTKAVQSTIAHYEGLSNKSLGGGILDSIEQQNKGIEEIRQQYQAEEKEANKKAESVIKAQEKQAKAVQDTVAQYENLSNKPLGNGVLDQIEQQNKGLEELKKQYKDQEKEQQKALDDIETARQKHFSKVQKDYEKQQQAIVDTQQKAIDKQVKAQNTLNESNQKAITLEQAKAKYVSQGYGKTDSTRLARLDVSGADVATINSYKDAIDTTRNSMRNLTPVALTANKSNNTLLGSIKGIAAYALLSTAIYATITALTDLAISVVATADEMSNLTQRLNIYLPANIKVNQVLERMGEIAKENRVSLADTGKLFTQLLPPIQRIKGGVAETTAIVDAFGKAMLVGGANTMEAASATIQFGQAMASGKLAGDEFRSLAEASPRLLQAIADGAGIAAQKLKEMSAAGKLTSGLVSSALLDQFIQLEYEALKMGQTVSGAFNEGIVAYQLFVNTFNEQTGFTTSIVESIRSVVKSLEGFGKGFLASLKDGDSTLNSFLGLLRTIWDIVGALVGGFTDVVGWILKAGEKTGLWKSIFDVTNLAIITIVDTLAKIPFAIVNIGTRLVESVLKPFEYFIALAQKGLDLAGFDTAAASLGQGLSNYRGVMGDIKGVTGEVVTGFNLLSLGVKETENSTGNVKNILDGLKQKNQDLLIQEKEKKAMSDSQYISEYAKLLLQKEGVDVNAENLNLVKKELEEHFKITQEQAKQLKISGEAQVKKDEAEKKAKEATDKAKKDAENELKRLADVRKNYQDQIDIVDRLNMLKAKGVSYDVAKIVAEKDYYDAYTDTAKALEVAEAKKALARFDMLGDLENETLLLTKVLALQEQGVSYDVARSLAQAGFAANSEGLLAASQSMHNTLVAQQYSIADQIKQQTLLNHFLSQGLGLEEATVRASYARLENIQKEAGLKGLSTEQRRLRAETVSMQKQLEAKKALSDVEEKINALNRERAFLTAATMGVYTPATISTAKLLATTEGLLYTDAQRQLIRQEENDLLNERIKNQLSLNSLLSGESETLRDVKNTYLFITDEEAKRIEANRKLVTLAEAYASKMEQQKTLPIGDFSNVNFDVFGDIGNPFKEALDGLNAFVSGNTKLDESLSLVDEQIEDLKTKSFVEEMFGNTDAANALTKQIEGQVNLGKDLQKQKEDTNDIAYGQGLKLAKSMFKEESKGYKIVSGMEKAYQAGKIAFQMWKNREKIKETALELWGYAKSAASYVATTATKVAAEGGLNIVKGIGAILSGAQQPGPLAFAGFAAMAALVAGLGIAVSGGGSSGNFAPTNEGTGTVFGDSEAKSASIANSIDLLSENSDLMLPLTSAMLRSLRNIESSIGGVTNLILRQETVGEGFNVQEGFKQNAIGGFLEKAGNSFFAGIGDFLGINKMLGSLLGGLFGTKTTIKGQGLFGDTQKLGDIITKGFDLFEYVDVQIKKKALGITTSTKNKTQTSAADAALENQFTLIFSGFYDSILNASASLGANMDTVKGNLENAVIRLGKIDLKGLKGDEIQEKLEAVFGAAADSLAQQGFAGLDDFQTVGEGYYETLIKVANGVEQATYFTDRLNVTAIAYTEILNKQGDVAAEIVRQSVLLTDKTKGIAGGLYELVNNFEGTAEEITDFVLTLRDLQDQLFMTGKNADYLTSSMILGAGGLDKLSSGFDAYFEMLSPAEQAAELTRRLTNEFAIFGKELPADVKAFRNLVSSIDITTEAGQKLYGQIIALAPEFNDLQDALDSANSDVNALVQSLRDLAEQARAARGETEQPRNLAFLRNEFESASILAMQGDTEAANRLLTLGKDLMQVSKLYALSGSEYAKDLALIQRAATVSADVQENGLGTSISPTLTPSNGTGATTPTIATTNSTMTTELQGMREELNAGLFAIAKFVQNVDSRTERWDDGGRMMVGILPENGDAPVPVAVVP